MSKHTKIWTEKKSQLEQKEKQLKAELETVSTIFEGKSKRILIATGIIGAAALIGYFGYKALSSKKEEEKPIEKVKSKVSKKAIATSLITERIISSMISYIGNIISDFLQSSGKNKS